MHNKESLQECINNCNDCHEECESVLFTHCIEIGGKHVEAKHMRLMADCIEICQTAANSMMRGSEMHVAICGACAEICEACADSCDEIGGDKMKACADICRRCARSCQEMSASHLRERATSGKEGTIMA